MSEPAVPAPVPCAWCSRPQTLVKTSPGELAPACVCCGGAGLDRDRACRHRGTQAELPLPSAGPRT